MRNVLDLPFVGVEALRLFTNAFARSVDPTETAERFARGGRIELVIDGAESCNGVDYMIEERTRLARTLHAVLSLSLATEGTMTMLDEHTVQTHHAASPQIIEPFSPLFKDSL